MYRELCPSGAISCCTINDVAVRLKSLLPHVSERKQGIHPHHTSHAEAFNEYLVRYVTFFRLRALIDGIS